MIKKRIYHTCAYPVSSLSTMYPSCLRSVRVQMVIKTDYNFLNTK